MHLFTMCQQQSHCPKRSLTGITTKGAREAIHLLVNFNIMGLLKMVLKAIIAGITFATHMANELFVTGLYCQKKQTFKLYLISET